MTDLRFFNPYAEIRHTENRLPHWQQEGAVYFVTFRLADSIPSKSSTSGRTSARHGYVFIPNLGTRKSSANITDAFPARSNSGSMPAMALVFCADRVARRSWPKLLIISKASVLQ
jgi:hypothetical protein